ncbi:MAG: preprotein translocase subunit SecE [Eubacteriales bacterium]|nr:preprotein translocase subunit SecE [Eubacteriales bacterium]
MSAMEKKEVKKNIFSPIVKFFKEIKSELKKVVFPTLKQTRVNTTVVIVTVILVGILIGVLDFAFNYGRNLLITTDKPVAEEQVNDAITENNQVDPVKSAQVILDELNNYKYDEKGNAIDEEGKVIVMQSAEGSVELNAENVAKIRESAQSVIDGAQDKADAPDEGGNQ